MPVLKGEQPGNNKRMAFDGLVKTIKVAEIKKTKFDNGGELVTVVGDDGKKYKINKTTSKGAPTRP